MESAIDIPEMNFSLSLTRGPYMLPTPWLAVAEAAIDKLPGSLRWGNKSIAAKIIKCGKDDNDTVIEFMLHQPASHYITESQGRKRIMMPLSLIQMGVGSSNEIGPHNYAELGELYDVSGLTPPPPSTLNRSATLGYGDQELLHLPAGYYVSNASVNFLGAIDGDQTPAVLVGKEVIRIGENWTQPRSFGQEYAILATFPAQDKAASKSLPQQQVRVDVECAPSPVTLQEWRLKTYEAIFRAYQKQALQAANQHGVGVGRNRVMQSPRQIERIELRQACLRLLRQRVDELTAEGLAKATSDAAFRRFAEQTFEWPAMRVDYYAQCGERSNKDKQIEPGAQEDADLKAFMEADRARVVVPVRAEHVPGLRHFLETGLRGKSNGPGETGNDTVRRE